MTNLAPNPTTEAGAELVRERSPFGLRYRVAEIEAEARTNALHELASLLDIRRETDGSWSVSVRCLPGHVGVGDTLEIACAEAHAAALLWIETARQPAPTTYTHHLGTGTHHPDAETCDECPQ
jgi:predicted RNase H-like HicB family nuclease